jgi:type IV pilus assembly protein PilW
MRHEILRRAHALPKPQQGLTLIELMISITIGLILVGAIGYLYISSRGAYRSNAAQSRVQEDGRFGLDAVMHDARLVGDVGCSSSANVNNAAAAPLSLPGTGSVGGTPAIPFVGPASALFGVHVASYGFTPPAAPFGPPATATTAPPWIAGDVLEMIIPTSKPVSLTADATGTSVAVADNSAGFRQNEYLMVANCVNAGIATVSSTPGGTGAVAVPINANLLVASAVPQLTTATHSSAQRIDAITYYVGQFPNRPWPALYRYSGTYGVAEEVIDHVENMSVLYGVGSAPPVTADAITAAGNWGAVTSVRVSLQVVGDEQSTAGANPSVALDTTQPPIPAPDSRLRQIFTATAALRNRLP